MTGRLEPDDGRRIDDALDRAIDDALCAELDGGPEHLRARVLARLEEPVDDRPSRWLVWFRPAMLPAAGALLIVAGLALSWWRVDEELGRIGSGQYLADARRAGRSTAPGTVARGGPAPAGAPAQAGESGASSPPAAGRETPLDAARDALGGAEGRRPAFAFQSAAGRPPAGARGGRILTASFLEMDRPGGSKGLAADLVAADEDEPESFLPGAIGSNLGDPVRPIPRPRPIVIPPIVAAPIVDAPPVSTLATPVSTLSGDSSSRGQSGPGKSEGVRP